MNAMDYDAAALGNHEFNYGIPLLRTFDGSSTSRCSAPTRWTPPSGRPASRRT